MKTIKIFFVVFCRLDQQLQMFLCPKLLGITIWDFKLSMQCCSYFVICVEFLSNSLYNAVNVPSCSAGVVKMP